MAICGITGSKGLIGTELLKEKIQKKIVKFNGDLKNKDDVYKWIRSNKLDSLIHLASIVPIKKVNSNYSEAKNVNYYGTKHLVDGIIKFNPKLKLFLFTSTAHVYKIKKKNVTIKENSNTLPSSKYGKTKLLAENYIKKKFGSKKIPYCIVRIFNIADKKQPKSFFYKSSFLKIKNNPKKNIIFNNINHYRDFINLRELVKIIKKLHKKRITGTFNVGTGKKTYLVDLIKLMCKKYNKNLKIVKNNNKTYLIANIDKLKKKLSLSKFQFDVLKNL
tara:strand:- start:288 stop:1112 length:825 start_codon:yes stop_codon:yes gene_type:complete